MTETTQRFANEFGTCSLTPLPGCPQICVSHAVFVLSQYRGKGEGIRNHELRLKRMKDMLYNVGMCTVRTENLCEKHILVKFGWKKIHTFHSKQSDSGIELWIKDL